MRNVICEIYFSSVLLISCFSVLTAGTKRGEYVESVIMNDETGAPPSEMPTNGKRRTDLILYNLETTQTNLVSLLPILSILVLFIHIFTYLIATYMYI